MASFTSEGPFEIRRAPGLTPGEGTLCCRTLSHKTGFERWGSGTIRSAVDEFRATSQVLTVRRAHAFGPSREPGPPGQRFSDAGRVARATQAKMGLLNPKGEMRRGELPQSVLRVEGFSCRHGASVPDRGSSS